VTRLEKVQEMAEYGQDMALEWMKGYTAARLSQPHILICDGERGDWEGAGRVCDTVCYCWCHL
jgi:hypothetical protein